MIQVYYDGQCHLCSREVEAMRRLAKPGTLDFVDITAADFNAAAEGIDPVRVHRTMHVRGDDGEMRTGLEALRTMWRPVPYFRYLAWVSGLPGLHFLSMLGYALFAWIRPKLPRRKCVSGTCRR